VGVICLLALVLSAVSVTNLSRAEESQTPSQGQVLPVLRPYTPKLLQSGIPVFLPTWLPATGKRVYPFVEVHPGSYSIQLSNNASGLCHACDSIWLTAYKGHPYNPSAFTGPVLLHPGSGFAHGEWAYLDPNYGGNAGISLVMVHSKPWNPKTPFHFPQQFSYEISYVQFHYIHVAGSLVLVNP
jgi:hypothetical protein